MKRLAALTGKALIGWILTSNEVPNNTGGIDLQRSREGYRLINDKGMTVLEKSTTRYDNRQEQTRERVEDAFKEEAIEKGFIRLIRSSGRILQASDFPDKYLINPGSGKLEESQPVYMIERRRNGLYS